jgi:hypothetical protein
MHSLGQRAHSAPKLAEAGVAVARFDAFKG